MLPPLTSLRWLRLIKADIIVRDLDRAMSLFQRILQMTMADAIPRKRMILLLRRKRSMLAVRGTLYPNLKSRLRTTHSLKEMTVLTTSISTKIP